MIHNNDKDRAEFIQWLKDNGLYYELISANNMRAMHTVYWTMKDNEEAQAEGVIA